MTPSQKAAAILALAGEENASKLAKNIPEYEIKKILRSFHRLPTLSEQDIENIAKEFLEIIKNLNSENNKFSFENAKRILYAANSSIKDTKWIESISDSFLIDEIRNSLNEMDEKILSNWFKNEHPQTMSLVLSICPPEKSSSLFKSLQENLRCEMILRISQMNSVDTPELENLYEELEKIQKNKNPPATRFVFQGVHTLMASNEERNWSEKEERKTRIVFIGRHLPKEVLEEGISLCVAK